MTLAKYPISFLSCGHGSVPPLPMPRDGVAARTSVRLGGLGIVDASLDVLLVCSCVWEVVVWDGSDIAWCSTLGMEGMV